MNEGLLWGAAALAALLRSQRRRDRAPGAASRPRCPVPTIWWRERHIIVRRLIEERDYARAYAVAAGHVQTEGFPLAQAEWVSGWLALRFLDRPADALRHFQRLYQNVATPISLARGAYWSGRASAALGRRRGGGKVVPRGGRPHHRLLWSAGGRGTGAADDHRTAARRAGRRGGAGRVCRAGAGSDRPAAEPTRPRRRGRPVPDPA